MFPCTDVAMSDGPSTQYYVDDLSIANPLKIVNNWFCSHLFYGLLKFYIAGIVESESSIKYRKTPVILLGFSRRNCHSREVFCMASFPRPYLHLTSAPPCEAH